MAKNLLVTGATGKQGGALISALLASKAAAEFNIIAVSRNPSSPAATALASKPNVRVIKGNSNDPTSFFTTAGVPIWGVFGVQLPMGQGQTAATEEKQGIQLVDAALKAHVKQFVYTSADRGGPKSSTTPTNIPHFISKFHIEKHLVAKAQGTDMAYCIFRPVAFMENLTNDFPGKGFTAAWRISLHGKPLQLVSTQDVGWFAAQAFINPKAWEGSELTLASDSLTYEQACQIFEQKTGQSMPTTYNLIARSFLWAVKDMGLMFKWFGTPGGGFGADIPALQKMNPNMLSFGDWLAQKSAWRKT